MPVASNENQPGHLTAFNRRFALAWKQIRECALRRMSHEPKDQSLDASDLVQETWLRLKKRATRIADQTRLMIEASLIMNRILTDRARRKRAAMRRAIGRRVPLELTDNPCPGLDEQKQALDEGIEKLESLRPRAARVLKLQRDGHSVPEIARQLDLSVSSVEKDLAFAKDWIRREFDRIERLE